MEHGFGGLSTFKVCLVIAKPNAFRSSGGVKSVGFRSAYFAKVIVGHSERLSPQEWFWNCRSTQPTDTVFGRQRFHQGVDTFRSLL